MTTEQEVLAAMRALCVEHDLDGLEMRATRTPDEFGDGSLTVWRKGDLRCIYTGGIAAAIARFPTPESRRAELAKEAADLEKKLAEARAWLNALPPSP